MHTIAFPHRAHRALVRSLFILCQPRAWFLGVHADVGGLKVAGKIIASILRIIAQRKTMEPTLAMPALSETVPKALEAFENQRADSYVYGFLY